MKNTPRTFVLLWQTLKRPGGEAGGAELNKRLILAVCIVASGLGFLKSSSVAVALPVIQRSLMISIAEVQWIANAYLLSLGALILTGGALADFFGLDRVFRAGIALVGVAGLMCAFAPNAVTLAVFHAVQGAGAALMIPCSLSIIRRTFGPHEQGRVIGLWAGLSGGIAALGPLVGGLLADISWRLVFAFAVPFAALAWAAAVWALPVFPTRRDRRPDRAGAVLLMVILFGLSFGVIRLPEHGFDVVVLLMFFGAVMSLPVFVLVERRAAAPLIPAEMLNRTLVGANCATFFQYFAFSGVLFLVAFGLQQLGGFRASTTGLALLPMTLVITFFSGYSGRFTDRFGPVPQMRLGPVLFSTGAVLLLLGAGAGSGAVAEAWVATRTLLWWSVAGLTVMGVGMVFIIPAVTTSAMSTEDEYAGAASGLNNALSRIAGLAATAAVGAVLVAMYRSSFSYELGTEALSALLTEAERTALIGEAGQLLESPTLQALTEAPAELSGSRGTQGVETAGTAGAVRTVAEGAFVQAYRAAVGLNLAAVALAFLSGLLIRSPGDRRRM
ncbi:MAG: MFS transporter [Spirochaetia bacterium]